MRELIRREHGLLADTGVPFEWDVGLTPKSTRMTMFDFGRVIMASKQWRSGAKPVALSFVPAWDYQGVYEPQGFHVGLLPISHQTGFIPDLSRWKAYLKELLREGDKQIQLVIINTQNNPTGLQWSPEVVSFLIDVAVEHQAWLLVDDAYFAVRDPKVPVTSALKILLGVALL